jgi:hypothetical protein
MSHFIDPLRAAADFLGPGAIEIPTFNPEITDLVRRTSTALNRLPKVPASGAPHRYFEQTAIATGSFTDPRNIAPSATAPTRVERSAVIKAVVAQSNLSLFDVDVTRQQGIFDYIERRDIEDIVNAVTLTQAQALWTGNDTSLTTPTTLQYMGLLNQITNQAVVAPGASIIDGIKAQVAAMVGNATYQVQPTAIYVNPILGDYIDREAKANKITLRDQDVGGLVVSSLMTQAGPLPVITDAFLPAATSASFGFSAPPSGTRNYFAAVLTENMIEMPYIGGPDKNPNPRLFQLGLIGNLAGQYVAVQFNTVIAKGPSYAHGIIAVQRP